MSVGNEPALSRPMTLQTVMGNVSIVDRGAGGMTYRQWLIGMCAGNSDIGTAEAIGEADKIIAQLDAEQEQKEDKS